MELDLDLDNVTPGDCYPEECPCGSWRFIDTTGERWIAVCNDHCGQPHIDLGPVKKGSGYHVEDWEQEYVRGS